MKINIVTNPTDAKEKIAIASNKHPDIKMIGNAIHHQGKQVAHYQIISTGIEITVTDKPWYISKALIESRLRELFA